MLGLLRGWAEQAVATLHTAAEASSSRPSWSQDGRSCIALRGIADPENAELVEQVADRLRLLAGVRWVEANAALGCVVVSHDKTVIETAELVADVDEAEELAGLNGSFAPASSAHPANPGRTLAHVAVIGANLTGLGYATVARALPVPALPKSVPSLVTTASATPKIWGAVQSRVGSSATDLLFSLGSAVTHTFAQEPTSLLMETGLRLSALRETQSGQRSWARWQAEFAKDPERCRCAAEPLQARPVSLPAGPVERTGKSSAVGAAAGFASALGLTGSLGRAEGFLVAATPRAAGMGREAFATQLGHALAERDILALDPGALRRLDRIDTVVVDADAVRTGKRIVHEVLPLVEDADTVQLWQQAHELVDGGGQRELLDGGRQRDWTLQAWGTRSRWPADLQDRLDEAADMGARICMLRHGARQVAVVVIVDELEPLTDQLLAAARSAGSLVLAGGGRRLGVRLGVERVVAGGTRLAGAVRALQAQGAGVAVVSAHGYAGLAAADVGLGAVGRDQPAPWGAHVFCGPGLGGCCVVLRQLQEAHRASLRCSQLAAGASVAGGVLALLGPAGTSQQRADVPTTVAALMALGGGTLWGFQAGQRPVPRAAPRTAWHGMSASQALEMLGSSSEGLPEDEVARRAEDQQQQAGYQPVGLLGATLAELDSPLTPALAGGAGISASIGALTDAAVIGAVLGMNALLGGVQRVRADRALGELMESSAVSVTVLRDGSQREVVSDALVVGDVVELVAGDSIPADCRVLEADGLQVDESSLTGESQLVGKEERATPAVALADRTSMLYQGSAVAAGRALGLVVATGPDTEARRTLTAEDAQPRTAGVAARLNSLAKRTTPLCIGAGALLLGVDMVRRQPVGAAVGRAVGLAVAAVPEGLPFVATMAELAAAQRLSQRGALVHNSATIEALGRAQVLCFDKTGTLTEGRISLRRVSDGTTSAPLSELGDSQRRVLGAALRASPSVANGEDLAHPTDRAVVDGAEEIGVNPTEGMSGWHRREELPFEPSRSYHAVLGSVGGRGQFVSVKGAPEIVLERCSYLRTNDTSIELDDEVRTALINDMDRWAQRGYRVLAVAERAASDRSDLDDARIRELHLVGMLALADTVRPTAAASVAQLQQAGVHIAMVTGDHPSTAEAIAEELGVLNGHRVLTGTDLDDLDDQGLSQIVGDVAAFARVTPEQKARIVRAYQDHDLVTAVTGDGANDAPAIRLADIGLALGERATSAAREAADVVITDDRIETIVDAVVEGRAMWVSVRDALAILLGGNLGEIGYSVITGLVSPTGGINARQLLLVNVLTDVLPSMAIAVRPPPKITAEMLLAEGPEASLGAALTRDIYRRGAITAAAATAAWFAGRATGTPRHAATVALVALIGAQLGQTLVLRGRTPLVAAAALASMGALVLAVQTPGVTTFFGSTPLWPHGWAIALGSATVATLASIVIPT